MDTHIVSKSSLESAAVAVSEAISVALSAFGHDAKNVHVLIDSIQRVGEEWQAVVRVLVQPDLEEELQELLTKENIIDSETLEKHQKQIEHEKAMHAALLEDALEFEETMEMNHALEMNEIAVFAYFPSSYENVYYAYDTIKPEHHHAHLIYSNDTWKQIDKLFPDLDFYQATHPVEPKPKMEGEKPPKFDAQVRNPEHRKPKYSDKKLEPHLE